MLEATGSSKEIHKEHIHIWRQSLMCFSNQRSVYERLFVPMCIVYGEEFK